jgi:hypothetical protein
MTTPDMLERLSTLAAQRTARTETVVDLVHALLARLEKVCEEGDWCEIAGHTLTLVRLRSNVGTETFWLYESDDDTCYLDTSLDYAGYLHGDFQTKVCGPSRAQILSFASRASGYVSRLVELRADDVGKLDKAIAEVKAAVGAFGEGTVTP